MKNRKKRYLQLPKYRYPKIKVSASCGCYVGPSEWQLGLGDWVYEPKDCNWEGIVKVDKEDWDDGIASIHCPQCRAELFQDMDHFEELIS